MQPNQQAPESSSALKESRDLHKRWSLERKLAEDEFKDWIKRSDKVVKRYRDERKTSDTGTRKFNILWSNVQTLTPAIYAKIPKPEVTRRQNDEDPVSRTAASILERALEYEVENYHDFDNALRNSLQDRLLGGRGTSWVRYEPHMMQSPMLTDDVETSEEIDYECAPCDYVHYKDMLHSPARTWEEVRWVSRDAYLTKAELIERFGEDAAKNVPLAYKPQALKDRENEGNRKEVSKEGEELEKALVMEIWCKTDKKVYWICPDHDTALDVKDDPLGLQDFFPCPRPLFATITTDNLIPVPDFTQYQDQADELDRVTARIDMLTKAVKAAGVYDATQKGVQQLLSENVDNRLIPVENFTAFSEKGGLKGVIDWMPLAEIITALRELYVARDSIKQTIYEITGLADIVRGASQASETATAQQIKSQFASLRIQMTQNDMARFSSDLLRLKAEIMAKHYQPKTLLMMSGIENTLDAEYAQPAIELLKSNPLRQFRIEVNSDSMVEIDVEEQKRGRVEFLTAAGGFLEQALPLAQTAPQMKPFLLELLNFGVRGFKAGRDVEGAFDQLKASMSKQVEMPVEVQQAQQEIQEQQMMLQEQGQQMQQEKIQIDEAGQKLTAEKQALDVEKTKFGLEKQAAEKMIQMKSAADKQGQQMAKEVEAFKAKGLQDVAGGIGEHMGALDQFSQQVGQALTQMAEAITTVREQQAQEIAQLSDGVQATQQLLMRYATAKRTPIRGANGRVEGVQIEGFDGETLQ